MVKTGIIILAILIVLLLGIGFFFFYEILGRNAKVFELINQKTSGEDLTGREKIYNGTMEQIKMYGAQKWTIISDEGKKLTAYFVPARGESDIVFILNHGYRGNFAVDFAEQIPDLYQRGYHLLLIDHQASNHSEGKYITFGYQESLDEFLWLQEIRNRLQKEMKLILYGVSMGSATVLMMSGDERLPDNVAFIIGDCGYTNAYRQIELTIRNTGFPCSEVLMAIVNFWSKLILHIDFNRVSPIDSVKRAKVPILFVHGDKDGFVPPYMAEELYDCCAAEKDKLIVRHADHVQAYITDTERYLEKVDSFIEKYARG